MSLKKGKRHKLCKSIHHKLNHIRKYTIYESTERNKTNVFKLYCYLQMNGSQEVEMFCYPSEISFFEHSFETLI